MLHKKRAGGCSSPSSSPWARRWRITNVCDSWPVRRQTYGYFPSHKVSPPIGWYQIILLGDIGTCVLTTCPGLHSTVGAGIQSWENKNNNQYIIDRCYVHVRTVFGHVTELCGVQTYWSLAAGRPAGLPGTRLMKAIQLINWLLTVTHAYPVTQRTWPSSWSSLYKVIRGWLMFSVDCVVSFSHVWIVLTCLAAVLYQSSCQRVNVRNWSHADKCYSTNMIGHSLRQPAPSTAWTHAENQWAINNKTNNKIVKQPLIQVKKSMKWAASLMLRR